MNIRYNDLEFTPLQLISYIHCNNKIWLLKLVKNILFRGAGVILDCHFLHNSPYAINLKPEKKEYIIEGNTFEIIDKEAK